jgi:hypothetical protein
MQNFRSANLVTGSPLGAVDITVMLTADNQFIMTQGVSLIHLQSDNTTATSRTFTLESGLNATMDPGGNNLLTIIFESGSSNTCQLVNTGNVKLTADWTPTQWQAISLRWNGQYWVEISRTPETLATVALTSGHLFIGSAGNVATDTALSGDATLANDGTLTIANLAVSTAKIAANAVTAAKVASDVFATTTVSLTQANITGMNGTPVQLLAAAAAGTYYYIQSVEILHTYSTAAYTGGGDLIIQYDSGATAIIDFDSSLVTAASSAQYVGRPTIYDLDASTGTSKGFDTAGAIAKSVTITNAVGAFGAGNAANILKVRLTYRVITALT